jgi:two-component system response regulator
MPSPTTADQHQCAGARPILLAEDSPDDEFVFLEIIRKSGIPNPVIVVRDGDDVMAYLQREGRFDDSKAFPLPSALFLDLRMPKVGGFEVLRWIKTKPHLRDLLLVILTHRHEINIIKEAYELGAHSFLTKPLTQVELNNLILHFQPHFHGSGNQYPQGASPSRGLA